MDSDGSEEPRTAAAMGERVEDDRHGAVAERWPAPEMVMAVRG